MGTKNTSFPCWGILCCTLALSAHAGNGTWTNLNGGSWADAVNWSGGIIADGADATAYFSTLNLAADATVALDGARTIGNLVFGDSTPDHNWSLGPGSGGFLVLSLSSGSPVITVNNQTATLGVVLAGTQGLAKAGAGTLVLAGANTYNGVTIINNGILGLGPNGSIAGSTMIAVAPGAVFDVSASGGFALGFGKALTAGRQSSFADDIIGSVTNAGTINIVAAGTAGTLTLSSNLCLSGGTVNLDLAYSNTPGAGVNDLLAVGGSLVLAGQTALNLNALSGSLQTGKTYTLLTYGGTFSGSVSNLTLAGYSFAANNQDGRLAAGAGAVTLTVSAWQPTRSAILPYVVAASPWPIDQRGNQRILVSVTQAVDAVRVDLPWRRRDSSPQSKNIVVVDATTGAVVSNRLAVAVTREWGEVVFKPQTVPGNYYLYYLPFTDDPNYGNYSGGYVSPQSTAASAWLSANGLPGSATNLSAATPVQIEARLPIDNFWPMEVPLTAAEKTDFLAAHPGGFLVFPEDRLHPIKMRDELPYRWLAVQSTNTFSGAALRDEYFAFQLGLYAVSQSVRNVHVTFSDLVPSGGGSFIPASAFNCLNLTGTNWDGGPLTQTVTVTQGLIQPLWMGVLIPPAAAPGLYTGTVTVAADNAPSTLVNLAITVDAAAAVHHGDDTPANHSRLRWLDSQLAVNDDLVPPYTPMTLSNQTVGVLGRSLTFTNLGLPSSILSGTTDILQSPVQFIVEVGGSPVPFSDGAPVVTVTNAGRVNWQSTASGSGLTLQTVAQMEFDGHLNYRITLTAASATTLSDVKLKIPLTAAASAFMAGIGYDGGLRPSGYSWRWSTPHDSVWLGGVKAGLHTELRGGAYHGPLLNLYHPAPPPTWGGGSVTVSNLGAGALLQANTGGKTLAAGAQVQYEFALLITPVKPLDTALQFGDRYYHGGGDPVPDWKDWHVNVINVHHATRLNPFLNWPFTDPATTTSFVTNYHAQGAKVKWYYTVRELTQKTVEIWALRSLGHEVLEGGSGGGFPWLSEHFVSDYSPAWYSPNVYGDYDAATTTSLNSRWYNYYVEGVNWLAQNDHMDGLYLDDVAYDRVTLKRVRRVLKQANPGSRIDLHSNTAFSLGPINQYAEFLPYLDRLWFGESFDYNALTPEQWLVQVSGIPFGLMGEMLQGGGNPWLGAVFGMARRYCWDGGGNADPRPVWRIWDQFGGLADATMVGWWEANPLVAASDPNVKVTAFHKNGKTLLAVGNFSSSQTTAALNVNWAALGLDPATASFYAPASGGFQTQALFQPGDSIPIGPKSGWMFIVQAGNTNVPMPAPRLVAHYLMSETNGTAVVDVLGQYNGMYVSGPVLGSTDVPVSSLSSLRSVTFSGGQWAELPAALADKVFRSGGSWTVSFWVRPTLPSPSYNATFTWMDSSGATTGILFYLEGNGSLDYWIGDGSTWNNWPNYNPGAGLQDRWYHVAASYDGASLRCYLDGQIVKFAAINTFVFPATGRPITLGLRAGASPQADLHGKMTDVRVYTGVLSDQSIQLLHSYPGRNVPGEASASSFSTLGAAWNSGTSLILSVPAVATWQYQLEASQDLATTNWLPLGPVLTAPPAGNLIAITNDISAFPKRYYRMQITL